MNELTAMHDQAPLSDSQDAAWAALNTPLSVDDLLVFCRDVERLFRINPMYEFKAWNADASGGVHWQGLNISQQPAIDVDVNLRIIEQQDGVRVEYTEGIKDSTTFRVEGSDTGSKLTIIDSYERLTPERREEHLAEVDKSLVTWAHDIQAYLIHWRRWSRIAPWRWYMRRVWQPMKPAGRRITYMLLWITLAELSVILLVAGIYWAEYR